MPSLSAKHSRIHFLLLWKWCTILDKFAATKQSCCVKRCGVVSSKNSISITLAIGDEFCEILNTLLKKNVDRTKLLSFSKVLLPFIVFSDR